MRILKRPAQRFVFVALVAFSSQAYAYIDPGVLTILYQTLYLFVFGILATVVFAPYRFIKNLLHRLVRGKRAPEKTDEGAGRPSDVQ